jgi:hypothetical protein
MHDDGAKNKCVHQISVYTFIPLLARCQHDLIKSKDNDSNFNIIYTSAVFFLFFHHHEQSKTYCLLKFSKK